MDEWSKSPKLSEKELAILLNQYSINTAVANLLGENECGAYDFEIKIVKDIQQNKEIVLSEIGKEAALEENRIVLKMIYQIKPKSEYIEVGINQLPSFISENDKLCNHIILTNPKLFAIIQKKISLEFNDITKQYSLLCRPIFILPDIHDEIILISTENKLLDVSDELYVLEEHQITYFKHFSIVENENKNDMFIIKTR